MSEISNNEKLRLLTELMDNLPCGAGIYAVGKDEPVRIVYLNRRYEKLVGEAARADGRTPAEDSVHPDDRDRMRQMVREAILTGRDVTYDLRMRSDGGYAPFRVTERAVCAEHGAYLLYATFTPVSGEERSYREMLPVVLNAMMASSTDLSFVKDRDLTYICCSSAFARMVGLSSERDIPGKTDFDLFDKALAEQYRADDRRLMESNKPLVNYVEEIPGEDGTIRYSSTSKYLLRDSRGDVIGLYGTGRDITDDRDAYAKLKLLTDSIPGGLASYELSPQGIRLLYMSDGVREAAEYPRDAFTEMMKADPLCRVFEEDRPVLQAAIDSLRASDAPINCTYRIRTGSGGYRWLNLRGAPAERRGETVLLNAAMFDVTKEHLAEQELRVKYELERRKPSLGEQTLLVHALFNLTTGETLEYAYRDGTTVPMEGRTAFTGEDDYLDVLLIDREERERFRAINQKAYLMDRYERGETEFSIDYRRLMPGGEVVWVRNILHLVRDPNSSDVLLFEYCYDVEEQKTRELMYRSLATDNYDYVARIDGKTGRYTVMHRAEKDAGSLAMQGEDADATTRIMVQSVVPEDREAVLDNTLVARIKARLKDRERNTFTFRYVGEDGTVRYKKMTQYYIDRQREIIVMTREDVSTLVQAEMEKNEMLKSALEAAKQASRAKSMFLSRMSHELRTPMNAIIGLSTLAAADVDNPAAMEDAIGKIGISARYLLSLINDILDMSRIESGRVTLNEEPFDFEKFVTGINTIIYGQAAAKGVDYDVVVNSYMEPIYVGDATKLQQVLVNILGNSVKFTKPGGKITWTMEQLCCNAGRATLRFSISDTGAGIDKAFLPHLFEPFSQESTLLTAASAGTGLGLSIARHLVEMMNGHIAVQSMKNVGSVFTVEVQLGISEKSRQHLELMAGMNLSRLRSLVVDDDVQVCKSMVNTLSSMGMEAEWVDTGNGAVERVKQVHETRRDFDTVFIDWKMPDMDGIETARQIRSIVGREVTIIMITAYDWRLIESDAVKAGVDLFIEKPLFQSSIMKAFERVFCQKKAEGEPKPAAQYDFTGKRILLAEDHPLNVEVAKRMLEKIGAEVVVAGNGLEAIELFTTAEENHFDAILMDIRMPVMDGLTAAKSIRNLHKQGSQTVPIVAMTANAFVEDVELSLQSGMNAHLGKPIEPHVLFSTLDRLMRGNG